MRNSRAQFVSMLCFLVAATLLLTNGFAGRIAAKGKEERSLWQQIEPIGDVLNEIRENYVREPHVDDVVEGAVRGMMNSLDQHSSYIPAKVFSKLVEETEGKFYGIGVKIHLDDDQNIEVFHPIEGSPAFRAGVLGGDIIVKIDGERAKGLSLAEAADKIKGPRGTTVHLTIYRRFEERDPEVLELDIKRDEIPLESVSEARVLDGGVGYIRVSEFMDPTAEELVRWIETLKEQGMTSLVLDLRWNPGGLLNASVEVCELFLPKGSLVTFTKVRDRSGGEGLVENDRYYTGKAPVLPENFPMIVLINEMTASSSEIVTGALQFHKRAIIVGVKTYGKGSVQTITRLRYPEGSAIRLTTALYYTPAHVTIDTTGIKPDVEVPMAKEEWIELLRQMWKSWEVGEHMRHAQNHGTVTGDEATDETVEDVQLQKAVEVLGESPVWADLVAKYHLDTSETQVASEENGGPPAEEDVEVAEDEPIMIKGDEGAVDEIMEKPEPEPEPAVVE